MTKTYMNQQWLICMERWQIAFRSLLFALIPSLCGICNAAEPVADAERLPRLKPTELEQVMDTFEVKEGFELELAAGEPLVVDPVAMDFDVFGRAYVVEMIGYSERRPERLGRVRFLIDEDQDGIFDHSHVFARDLPWPTALVCYDGGVFVGATPDIYYLKDTDGDGIADLRRKVFTGFAADSAPYRVDQLNMQAMMNSFHWGADNRIHGATGLVGGRVYSPMVPGQQPVNLRGHDFSFDPRSLDIRPESGGAQNGMSFDANGEKFVCSNSDHLQHVVYDDVYAGINPLAPSRLARISIAEDGPAAPVFRISPDEPWRVIRTKWRVAGAVGGPVEGGGTPSGYFTGATGATIFTGDAWGDEFFGNAFTADCGSNLVHRKQLFRNGYTWTARRPAAEQGTEFVRSSDNWFRPVQFANGPDGNLYILDMYREVIEHPWSIPAGIKQFLDLNSGNDRGRIYRLKRKGAQFSQRPMPGHQETANLISMLGHSNTWHRITATRLLYERQDASLVPVLRDVIKHSDRSDARMDAYQVLDGLGELGADDVLDGLRDDSSKVRLAMLRRVGHMDQLPVSREAWLGVMTDLVLDREARFQAILALARHPVASGAQASLLWQAMALETEDKRWLQFAVLQAMGNCQTEFLNKLIVMRDTGASVFHDAAAFYRMLGASGDKERISLGFTWLQIKSVGLSEVAFLTSLGEGLKLSGQSWGTVLNEGLSQKARNKYQGWLSHSGLTHKQLAQQVIALMGQFLSAEIKQQWWEWLEAEAWLPLHADLLAALKSSLDDQDLERFWSAWPHWSAQSRQVATAHLLSKHAWTERFLREAEEKPYMLGDLTFAQRRGLLGHKAASIRSLAGELLTPHESVADGSLTATFLPSLLLEADLENGHRLFMERCATCHRGNGEGFAVGPDLVSVKTSGKHRLLDSILFPNKEAQPQFMSYLVSTKDGEEYEGLVGQETESSITLRQSGGLNVTVSRDNVQIFHGTGRSLMPEGLSAGMNVQDMADLLEFIVRLKR